MINLEPPLHEFPPPGEAGILADPIAYNWTLVRKNEVITKSETEFGTYIDQMTGLEGEDHGVLKELWSNIVDCSQEGGKLKIKGEELYDFDPNFLATHSEYHIAKVLTLGMKISEIEKPQASLENKLASNLSILIHDLGSLHRKGESETQPLLYEKHELRAIEMVDRIVGAMQLDHLSSQGVDINRLKAKIKLLVASTYVNFDMDFAKKDINNLPIIRLMKGEAPEEIFKGWPKDQYRDEMIGKVREALTGIPAGETEEMIEMVQIMAACDMGSYILEPCRLGEIIGLWQELNEIFWDPATNSYRHRKLPFGIETYHQYLVSKFPEDQIAIFGGKLKKLGKNPFMEQHTVTQTLEDVGSLKQQLSDRAKSDPLLRFEGFFPPVVLEKIIEKMFPPEAPSDISSVRDALITYSREFSRKLHSPGEFNSLATPVLREIFQKLDQSKRKEFFLLALESIEKGISDEILAEGEYHLHIAPQAYLAEEENIETMTDPFRQALTEFSEKVGNRKIASVTLTYRSDKNDDIDELIRIARENSRDDRLWQISIAGEPVSADRLKELLGKVSQAGLNAVVHFGLEEHFEDFDRRMDEILNKPDTGKMRIHIDDHFDRVTGYKRHLEELVNKNKLAADKKDEMISNLKKLIKSLNPLGSVLTRGDQEFEALKKFFAEFPECLEQIASHNAGLWGGLGTTANRVLSANSAII